MIVFIFGFGVICYIVLFFGMLIYLCLLIIKQSEEADRLEIINKARLRELGLLKPKRKWW